MKNRAKCKLCSSIIESFHSTDYVMCNCGHIFVDGGDAMYCGADDWKNFLRVDDDGNEIIPTIKDKVEDVKPLYNENTPSREDLLKILDEMIKSIENMPQERMLMPINHYDFASSLLLISSILRAS